MRKCKKIRKGLKIYPGDFYFPCYKMNWISCLRRIFINTCFDTWSDLFILKIENSNFLITEQIQNTNIPTWTCKDDKTRTETACGINALYRFSLYTSWCLLKHLWNYSARCFQCKKRQQKICTITNIIRKMNFCWKKDFHLKKEKIFFTEFSFIAFCAYVD